MDQEIDNFLNSKIKCFSCGDGPINFSLTYDYNENLIPKYGNFCSMGCYMNFYNYDDLERNKREISRSNTPTN